MWITSADGRATPGHALAFDGETGFGLVQPLGKLNLPKLELGRERLGEAGRRGSVRVLRRAAAGDRDQGGRPAGVRRLLGIPVGRGDLHRPRASVLGRAAARWSARIGKLLGVGSLILQQGDGKGRRHDMNMIVPIDMLPPVLNDLRRYGQVNRPAPAVAGRVCHGG